MGVKTRLPRRGKWMNMLCSIAESPTDPGGRSTQGNVKSLLPLKGGGRSTPYPPRGVPEAMRERFFFLPFSSMKKIHSIGKAISSKRVLILRG